MAKRSFKALRDRMSTASQVRAHEKANRYRAEMAINELREARQLTQESLAEILGVNQSAISKLEKRTDMYLSTLKKIVKAMGGTLRIEVVFPDGKVEINQFKDIRVAEDEDGQSKKKTA